MIIILFGMGSFVITGVDDLLVLVMFYMTFKNRFKEVLTGTLLGLIAVMIPSFIFVKFLSFFSMNDYLRTDWILSGVLGFIAFRLIRDGFSQKEKEELEDITRKTSLQVMAMCGVTYFLNGLDDFVVYSGFYLKYETFYEISLFSLGIILGLVLFAFVSAALGKKFYEFEQKFQNKIKIVLGSAVMLIAISLLFLWVVLKNTTFFYLNLKKDFFLYNYP